MISYINQQLLCRSFHSTSLFRGALFLLLLLPAFVQSGQIPWADGRSRGSDLQIKLVTFGVGDDIPSYWGHIALIVEDVHLLEAKIYNYGLYSFGDGMITNFLMGRLIFSGGSFSVPGYLNYYRNLNREIRVATLNLSNTKKVQLAAKLAHSVLPENRDYLYHHYDDNCATRLRDLLDEAVDGQLLTATSLPAQLDFRAHTRRYTARTPWLEMGLMFLMNDEIDRPVRIWDEMFLPDILEEQVRQLTYSDSSGTMQALVSDYIVLYKPERDSVPAKVPLHWPAALLVSFLISIIGFVFYLFGRKKMDGFAGTLLGAYQALLGLLLGIPGTILFLMSTFTEHSVTYFNENLFYANPLYLLLVVFGISLAYGNKKAIRKMYYFWLIQAGLTLLGLILKLLPGFNQNNGLVLAFLLPLIFLSFLTSRFLYKK